MVTLYNNYTLLSIINILVNASFIIYKAAFLKSGRLLCVPLRQVVEVHM